METEFIQLQQQSLQTQEIVCSEYDALQGELVLNILQSEKQAVREKEEGT